MLFSPCGILEEWYTSSMVPCMGIIHIYNTISMRQRYLRITGALVLLFGVLVATPTPAQASWIDCSPAPIAACSLGLGPFAPQNGCGPNLFGCCDDSTSCNICGDSACDFIQNYDAIGNPTTTTPETNANCPADCPAPVCGNGVTEAPETCDDNNVVSGDGCSATCVLETCSDGILNNGETAIDCGGVNCAPCVGGTCGDGTLDPDGFDLIPGNFDDEECDDGNVTPGDGCSATCIIEFCGDGIINNLLAGNEICDDANAVDYDGCYGSCQITGICCGIGPSSGTCVGAVGPGCIGSGVCTGFLGGTIESGPTCSAGAVCGNGVIEAGETCDDSNVTPGDGCSATCQTEATCPTPSTGNVCSVGTGVCQANGVLVCSGAGIDTCSATVPECVTVPNPLAMAKSVGAIVDNGNGTYDVPFTIILQNTSTFLTLENVQATDNMFTTFGAGFTSVLANIVGNNVIGSTALSANPGYNGNGNSLLLAAGGTMAPGSRATITVLIRVTPGGNLGNPVPYFNQATMQGTLFNAATGIRDATVQSDLSDNGNNPDANGNGFGGDVGENDPTPISFVETGIVGVAKAAGTVVDNGNGTYDIPLNFVMTNMGNTVLNNIQLTDSLVATFGAVPYTILSLSASGGYVTNGSYNGNGDVNLLAAGQSLPVANTVLVALSVRITPGVTPGPWTNTAVGSGTTPGLTTVTDDSTDGADPDPNNDGNPIENTPTPIGIPATIPLIGVAKQAGVPNNVGGGQHDVTYLFTITNYGNTNLTNISLPENFDTVFPFPASWTLVGAPVATGTLVVNPGYTGTAGAPNLLSAASTLAVGATQTVAVTVRVTPGVNAGPYNNTVVVTGTPPTGPVVTDTSVNGINPDANFNGNPTDDTSPTTVVFTLLADLSLTKTSSLATVHNGDLVSFTLTLTNSGPSPTTGVVVQDLLPAAYTYLSHTPALELYNQGTGQWNVGAMAIGEVRTLVINVQVANVTLPLTNTAEVTASFTTDPDSLPGDGLGDDFATVTPVGRALVDLSLTKTVPPGVVNVGGNALFTITINNAGPDTATGIVVQEYIPAGLSLVSVSTPPGTSYNLLTNEWSITTLASGASLVLSLDMSVLAPGPYQNAVEVESVTGNPDDVDSTPGNGPNAEDDYATATPAVNGATDLALTKVVNNATPLVGSNVTFTVTLTNQSGVAATGVQVMDQLPSGYSYVSHTVSVGTYVPGSGSWTVGNIAAAGVETLSIVATVLPTGVYANFAQVMNSSPVDLDSTPGDSNFVLGEDDWGSATPVPAPVFDLTLTKSVNNATPAYLSNVVFTVSVLNNGPSIAPPTVISDLLPVGLTYISHVTGSGAYVPATGAWTTAAIPVGTTITLQIIARVDTRNAITNIASIPSIPAEPPAPVTVTPLLATVTGHLFQDDNENGVQNGNEDDLDDISVTITDATGIPQTVVTDNNGNYSVQVAPGMVTAVIDQNDNDFPDKYIITVGTYSVTVNAPVSVATAAHYFGIDPKSGKNDDDKKKKRSVTVVIQRRLASTGLDLGAGQTLATVALLAIGALNLRRRRSD